MPTSTSLRNDHLTLLGILIGTLVGYAAGSGMLTEFFVRVFGS